MQNMVTGSGHVLLSKNENKFFSSANMLFIILHCRLYPFTSCLCRKYKITCIKMLGVAVVHAKTDLRQLKELISTSET